MSARGRQGGDCSVHKCGGAGASGGSGMRERATCAATRAGSGVVCGVVLMVSECELFHTFVSVGERKLKLT